MDVERSQLRSRETGWLITWHWVDNFLMLFVSFMKHSASFNFFNNSDIANPLVASQWRQGVPQFQQRTV